MMTEKSGGSPLVLGLVMLPVFKRLSDTPAIRAVAEVVRADGRRIVVIAGLTAALVWLALSFVPSVHKAEWTVRVTGRDATPATSPAVAAALTSDKTLLAVAARLKLAANPEFVGSPGVLTRMASLIGLGSGASPRSTDPELAAALRRTLTVTAPPNTQRLELVARAVDPRLSAALLTAWVEAWRADARASAQSQATATLAADESRLSSLAAAIREKSATIDTLRRPGPTSDEMGDLERRTAEAEAAAAAATERARSARELLARGQPADIPEVQAAPALHALWQQRARVDQQIAEYQASLKPNHPRMRQLAAERASIERQIGEEAAHLVAGLERTARSAQQDAEAARKLFEAAGAAGDGVRLVELERSLASLLAEAKALEQATVNLKAEIAAGSLALPVALSASGQPALSSSGPSRLRWTILAALIVAVALTVLRLRLNGIGTTAAIRQPAARGRGKSSPLALSITDAAARTLIAAMERKGFRTVVATETPATGAIVEATALARALASDGRQVLLIDVTGDGGLAHATSPLRGLADVIADGRFDDAIVELPRSDVHLMTWNGHRTGSKTANAAGLNAAMDALDDVYDHIVLAGEREDLARVFEAIEGRVDLAFVTDGIPGGDGETVRLLGFDVADLVVLPLQSAAAKPDTSTRRKGPGTGGSRRAA